MCCGGGGLWGETPGESGQAQYVDHPTVQLESAADGSGRHDAAGTG
jgi:hypothetical protein